MNLLKFFTDKKNAARCKRGDLPPFVCEYLAQTQQASHNQSLEEARFVVFDTETTGLNPQKDAVISIGAVAVEGLSICIEDSFEMMVQQDSAGDRESITVHQILSNELEDGEIEIAALEAFLKYIKGDILVAHFAAFDVQMISKMLKQHFQIGLQNASIDTIELSKRVIMGKYSTTPTKQGEFMLDTLCERFGIPITSRHKAAGDALATAKLFQLLLHKSKQKGIKKVKELF